MGAFSRALRIEYRDKRPQDRWWYNNWSYNYTKAGISISEDTALSILALYAGIKLIAEDVARLPWHVYQRFSGGKRVAPEHPAYGLLHDNPNPEMTSMSFREAMTGQYILRGNSFAEIEWSRGGRPLNLWPLRSDRMSLWRSPRKLELFYVYHLPNGEYALLPRENVLHLRGFSAGGWWGMSLVDQIKEDLAGMVAARDWNNALYANDATPGGVLVHPEAIGDVARTNIENSWNEMHQGLDNKHRIAVLEEGVEWKKVGLNPEEVQFIDRMRWDVEQVARVLRLSPAKLSDYSRATYSNIEEGNIDHVVSTLDSHFVRWEQQTNKDLLDTRSTGAFNEINRSALVRGKILDRYRAYAIAINWGFMNPDEARDFENWNPIEPEFGDGKTYLRPVNMSEQNAEELLLDDGEDERGGQSTSDNGQNGGNNTRQRNAAFRELLRLAGD